MKKALFCLLVLALIIPAQATLVNRYSFTTGGTLAIDSVGGKDGNLMNGATISGGQLVLNAGASGRSAPHVALPADVLSDYTSVSIEFWYTINIDQNWQRVFDFGETDGSNGGNYIMYTPTSGGTDAGTSRFSITTGGIPGYLEEYGEQWAETDNSALNVEIHAVCVYDETTSQMRLYQNGVLVDEITTKHSLTNVARSMALIGAALYNDPGYSGTINEFRIYDHVMSDEEVAFNYTLGPDTYNRVVVESVTPTDGAKNVATDPTLSWTVASDITPSGYHLYVGTDPNMLDPNANMTTYATVANLALTANSHALSSLDRETTYYWRVDTTADGKTYISYTYTFDTLPNSPIIVTPPTHQYVMLGDDAVYTLVTQKPIPGSSDITINWYKEMGETDQELTSGVGNVTIDTINDGDIYTSTLTFSNVTAADDGLIYATATNTGGTSTTANVMVYVKRLYAYYPFEGNADDASGSELHGTGATLGTEPDNILPSYSAGVSGQAVDLSNTYKNYIDLPDGFANFLGGITINFWAKPTAAGGWANFMQFSNGAPLENIFVSRESTTSNFIFRNATGINQNTLLRGTVAIEQDKWQMFTATQDASGVAKLYKNGLQYYYFNTNGTHNTPQVTMPMPTNITRVNNYIGKSAWNDAYFNGQLDEIRVYNYALTADEIAAQYYADGGVPACQVKPEADLNNDCQVTIADVAIMAAGWLDCGLYPESTCQ